MVPAPLFFVLHRGLITKQRTIENNRNVEMPSNAKDSIGRKDPHNRKHGRDEESETNHEPDDHDRQHHHHRHIHHHSSQGRSSRKKQRSEKDATTTYCPTFASMQLKPDLLRGIYAYGFEKPSAIQQRAIKPILQGRDVIAQSQVQCQ